ncbi:MAG: DNA/RNA nuclease SfsA, partial [Methanobacteriaceae archaeon]
DDSNLGSDCFVEVKGVTLIKDGIAQFPDAPTERGRRHLEELIELKKEGHRACVFFLIQHPNGNSFKPNWENDPEFAKTLVKAHREGVEILVYKCKNSLDKIEIEEKEIDFDLSK